jgi:Uma2 family endonuclease
MTGVAEPLLMTVDEYRQLPDREDVIQELHWGMVVTLSRPKMQHAKLQHRLAELLRPKAEHLGIIATEVAFRALPEYDLRGADVAYISQRRWDATDDDDNLCGSPELAIEVLSPSGWWTRNGKPSASHAKVESQRFIISATAFRSRCSTAIWMYPRFSGLDGAQLST